MLSGIKVVESVDIKKFTTQDLAIGEIGLITGDYHNGELLLRHHDGFVSLTNPRNTWKEGTTLYVRKVENATVTLTFGTGD